MKYGELIIEKKEYNFLKQLITLARYYKDSTYRESIHKLHQEMLSAKVMKSEEMPPDVIRLNATVTIQTSFEVEKTYQIVTPEKSDLKNEKISILAPMGLALFGYAEGDEIMWKFPIGQRAIKIIKVKQEQPLLIKTNYDKQHSGASQ